MSDPEDAHATTAATPAEPTPQPDAEDSDSGGEPTAAKALARADGQAASSAEAAALPPLGGQGDLAQTPLPPMPHLQSERERIFWPRSKL